MHAPVLINDREGAIRIRPARPTSPDRVVLVHCSASSARQWDPLVAELAGFQAIAVDLYGHGKRPRWHGDGALTLAHEAAAIWNAVPAGEPFHLVGHSYGGAVALRFALSFPERLRSLTLIEPSCFHVLVDEIESHARALAEIRSVAGAINCAVLSGDYRGGMETFIDYWGGAGTWKRAPEERKAQFANLAVGVAHHFCSLIGEPTPLAACMDIHVPTLVLCGTNSPGPAQLIAQLIADTIPHAQRRMIAGANHMSPITHPHEVNPLILRHVRCHGQEGTGTDGGHTFGSRRFVAISGAAVRAF
jgi:pimeloyl-ACP methyl ester carboxylesterase